MFQRLKCQKIMFKPWKGVQSFSRSANGTADDLNRSNSYKLLRQIWPLKRLIGKFFDPESLDLIATKDRVVRIVDKSMQTKESFTPKELSENRAVECID